jgi:hypothetical protein
LKNFILVSWKEALEIHEKAFNERGDDMNLGDLLEGALNFGNGKKGKGKGNGNGNNDIFGDLESMMFEMMGGDLNMNDFDIGDFGSKGQKKKGRGKKK